MERFGEDVQFGDLVRIVLEKPVEIDPSDREEMGDMIALVPGVDGEVRGYFSHKEIKSPTEVHLFLDSGGLVCHRTRFHYNPLENDYWGIKILGYEVMERLKKVDSKISRTATPPAVEPTLTPEGSL